jgi:hypothetical protein
MQKFETRSVKMERILLVTVQMPVEDVDRIMKQVATVAPLAMGKYDSNAYQSGAGVERYRPLDGAAAGAEDDVRLRPDVVEVNFELPEDQELVVST